MNDTATTTTTTPAAADITRMAWKPSSEEMTKFKTREVELCIQTIRRGAATNPHHTLYSQMTWDAALAELGGKLPEIPADVANSLKVMREIAAESANAHIKFGKNGFSRR